MSQPLFSLCHATREKHGQAIGYNVRFSPADIRAMGISVLIGMQRDAA